MIQNADLGQQVTALKAMKESNGPWLLTAMTSPFS